MRTKILLSVLAVILVVTCVPLTAMAADNAGQEINFFDGGYYIVDKDGNIRQQSRFIIDDQGKTLQPGDEIYFTKDCWYNGGRMTLSVSVTGGYVNKLQAFLFKAPESTTYEFGNFTAVSGDWYGQVSKVIPRTPGYYNYGLRNTSKVDIRIDSFTGNES